MKLEDLLEVCFKKPSIYAEPWTIRMQLRWFPCNCIRMD